MKLFSDQEVVRAFSQAPKAVTDYIENGDEMTAIVMDLSRQFSLLIDQTGTIAVLIRNVLVGLITPQKFVTELVSSVGISSSDAQKVVREVSDKIFAPLQAQMRRGGTGQQGQGGSAAAPPPRPQAQRPAAPRVPVGFNNAPPRPAVVQSAARSAMLQPAAIREPIMDPERELPSEIQSSARPDEVPPQVSVPTLPSVGAPLPPKVAMPRPLASFEESRGVAPFPAAVPPPQLPPQPFGGVRQPTSTITLPGTLPARPVPPPPVAPSGSDPYREPVE